MSKAKTHSVKVGTVPMLIVYRYRYKIEPGKRVEFRKAGLRNDWQTGIVRKVNDDDGYTFIDRF